eukprot:6939519-Pyramimonas_sp.AAC.1
MCIRDRREAPRLHWLHGGLRQPRTRVSSIDAGDPDCTLHEKTEYELAGEERCKVNCSVAEALLFLDVPP